MGVTACQPSEDVSSEALGVPEDWEILEAYLVMDKVWHARDEEIRRMKVPDDEKARLRGGTQGDHPDVTLAAAAARRIIETGRSRVREAAEFLVDHSFASSIHENNVTLGMATLAKEVGPDWMTVESYLDGLRNWREASHAIDTADVSDEEKQESLEQLGARPKATHAIAAAMAIIDAGADHPRLLEAAEFLIGRAAHELGANTHVLMAANALATYFPHYDDWPVMLQMIAGMFSPSEEISGFVRTLAERAEDPLVRATARYHAAAMLIPKINARRTTPAERETLRMQAIQLAKGMSRGIEQALFGSLGTSPTTFAEREASLLATIQTMTVGVRVPSIVGTRLDGSQEDLSAFAGQVVLVDFWATWCGPCVDALPKLRKFVQDLPADRFEILSISVDDEVEIVTEFQIDEPMPWANWHAQIDGDLLNSWQVREFPTYVLLDEEGLVLAREYHIDERFGSLIHEAVQGIEQGTS